MTLRNYHSDSVCLTKVNFATSLLIFFQDELIQVEAGNHQTETTVIQQNVSSQFQDVFAKKSNYDHTR